MARDNNVTYHKCGSTSNIVILQEYTLRRIVPIVSIVNICLTVKCTSIFLHFIIPTYIIMCIA